MKSILFEFHVNKHARIKYGIRENLFAFNGDLIIASFKQARELALIINEQRKNEDNSSGTVTAGHINALGLLHEIFHYAIRHYEDKQNPGVFSRSISYFKEKLGNQNLDKVLLDFIKVFPPQAVFNNTISPEDYLIAAQENKTNREILIEELILLNLENLNSAFPSLTELYDDNNLEEKKEYLRLINEADKFFSNEKPFSPENISLIQALKKPIIENPSDPLKQLDYIKNNWASILDENVLLKILGGADLLKEDNRLFETHFGGWGTKPSPPVPVYKSFEEETAGLKRSLLIDNRIPESTSVSYGSEPERFTEDIEWMPNVVMIAKNAYVWLDQLSGKYSRSITRLDQIPDEELDIFASWNLTALWLIGIWERSRASQKIKQFMGNPEAAASAYSLYDYEIAAELGGEEAFQNLKDRAWHRGIRIASDMVPNHTGIFSRWMIEHPEYFIQCDYPPYPNYSFTGINLSDDPSIQLRIEDRYYNRTDAAVVFQRIDNKTGKVIYIYHGNDGTNMPWNDTAQLNLLKPEVREALIQTIMKVARKSPIIRFDAAMTLTKKHYQRLWFPLPGTGGAIPSRADFAMSRETFDSFMHEEFWREVVDRINNQMPNTLLLAEAFWLMEGYFVRSLGMHRVYNSAFMHMFMKEENDKFRLLIKNTLEFNPEILKRYVNFMSNPDEETAINQFGKGDKYFGVAVMMVTLPGLPMFGHGQVEGLTEKYGMEYRKAYYKEQPDENLINRHKSEIFPLIKKRDLFSQVYNFEFYDFIDDSGNLNENVMCFSNSADMQKTLVFYNNSYSSTSGRVNYSCHKIENTNSDQPVLTNKKLAEALQINSAPGYYYSFRDTKTQMEYILSGKQINESGFSANLQGYQYHVFVDFKEHFDYNGELGNLDSHLNGCGVPSINRILLELKLFNFHNALKELISFNSLIEFEEYFGRKQEKEQPVLSSYLKTKVYNVLGQIKHLEDADFNSDEIIKKISYAFRTVQWLLDQKETSQVGLNTEGLCFINKFLTKDRNKHNLEFLYSWIIMKNIFRGFNASTLEEKAAIFGNYLLDAPILHAFDSFNNSFNNSRYEYDLLKILLTRENFFGKENLHDSKELPQHKAQVEKSTSIVNSLLNLLKDLHVKHSLYVNSFEGKEYFNKEAFEEFITWFFVLDALDVLTSAHVIEIPETGIQASQIIAEHLELTESFYLKAETSGYQLALFTESI